MLNMWPQILVASFLVCIVVAGFVRHGKAEPEKPIHCMDVVWRALVIAAILGAGGFWRFP